jgi:hypothetical protein
MFRSFIRSTIAFVWPSAQRDVVGRRRWRRLVPGDGRGRRARSRRDAKRRPLELEVRLDVEVLPRVVAQGTVDDLLDVLLASVSSLPVYGTELPAS